MSKLVSVSHIKIVSPRKLETDSTLSEMFFFSNTALHFLLHVPTNISLNDFQISIFKHFFTRSIKPDLEKVEAVEFE